MTSGSVMEVAEAGRRETEGDWSVPLHSRALSSTALARSPLLLPRGGRVEGPHSLMTAASYSKLKVDAQRIFRHHWFSDAVAIAEAN